MHPNTMPTITTTTTTTTTTIITTTTLSSSSSSTTYNSNSTFSSQRDRDRLREQRERRSALDQTNDGALPSNLFGTETVKRVQEDPNIKNALGSFNDFQLICKQQTTPLSSFEVLNPGLVGISSREVNRRKMEEILTEMTQSLTMEPVTGLDDIDDFLPPPPPSLSSSHHQYQLLNHVPSSSFNRNQQQYLSPTLPSQSVGTTARQIHHHHHNVASVTSSSNTNNTQNLTIATTTAAVVTTTASNKNTTPNTTITSPYLNLQQKIQQQQSGIPSVRQLKTSNHLMKNGGPRLSASSSSSSSSESSSSASEKNAGLSGEESSSDEKDSDDENSSSSLSQSDEESGDTRIKVKNKKQNTNNVDSFFDANGKSSKVSRSILSDGSNHFHDLESNKRPKLSASSREKSHKESPSVSLNHRDRPPKSEKLFSKHKQQQQQNTISSNNNSQTNNWDLENFIPSVNNSNSNASSIAQQDDQLKSTNKQKTPKDTQQQQVLQYNNKAQRNHADDHQVLKKKINDKETTASQQNSFSSNKHRSSVSMQNLSLQQQPLTTTATSLPIKKKKLEPTTKTMKEQPLHQRLSLVSNDPKTKTTTTANSHTKQMQHRSYPDFLRNEDVHGDQIDDNVVMDQQESNGGVVFEKSSSKTCSIPATLFMQKASKPQHSKQTNNNDSFVLRKGSNHLTTSQNNNNSSLPHSKNINDDNNGFNQKFLMDRSESSLDPFNHDNNSQWNQQETKRSKNSEINKNNKNSSSSMKASVVSLNNKNNEQPLLANNKIENKSTIKSNNSSPSVNFDSINTHHHHQTALNNKRSKYSVLVPSVPKKENGSSLLPPPTILVHDARNREILNESPPLPQPNKQLLVSIDISRLTAPPVVDRNGNIVVQSAGQRHPTKHATSPSKTKDSTDIAKQDHQTSKNKRIKNTSSSTISTGKHSIKQSNNNKSQIADQNANLDHKTILNKNFSPSSKKKKEPKCLDFSEQGPMSKNLNSSSISQQQTTSHLVSFPVSIPVNSINLKNGNVGCSPQQILKRSSPVTAATITTTSFCKDESDALNKATQVKRSADKVQNLQQQMLQYIEASIYFVQAGIFMEQKRIDSDIDKAASLYKDTLVLIKQAMTKFMKNFNNSGGGGNSSRSTMMDLNDLKLLVLINRFQALLNSRLTKMKAREIHDGRESIAQFTKEHESVLPVKTKDGDKSLSLTNNNISVPINVIHIYNKQLSLLAYPYAAHDFWIKAETIIEQNSEVREFIEKIEQDLDQHHHSSLHLGSSLEQLLNHTMKGVRTIKL